jgi:hypothetical protein
VTRSRNNYCKGRSSKSCGLGRGLPIGTLARLESLHFESKRRSQRKVLQKVSCHHPSYPARQGRNLRRHRLCRGISGNGAAGGVGFACVCAGSAMAACGRSWRQSSTRWRTWIRAANETSAGRCRLHRPAGGHGCTPPQFLRQEIRQEIRKVRSRSQIREKEKSIETHCTKIKSSWSLILNRVGWRIIYTRVLPCF